MIAAFRNRALQNLWARNDPRGVNPQHVEKLRRILFALSRAARPEAMNLPGYRLHRLSGGAADRWSVRVSGNWRVTFSFDRDGDVIDVDYEDYH